MSDPVMLGNVLVILVTCYGNQLACTRVYIIIIAQCVGGSKA